MNLDISRTKGFGIIALSQGNRRNTYNRDIARPQNASNNQPIGHTGGSRDVLSCS